MKCPSCESTQISKNGRRRGKQALICKYCYRQFLESYSPREYSDDAKEICLRIYVNGMGFRAIERVTGVNHNTIINWVKLAATLLPDAPEYEQIPEIAQVDELQTFVGSKKNKIWLWTAVNKGTPGILDWVIGNRSAETFKRLWKIIRGCPCFFYVTDGYAVYSSLIDDADHLVSKTGNPKKDRIRENGRR